MTVLVSEESCNCSHPTINKSRYVLTDFGFSKPYSGEQYSSGRSGSDGYRAPELTNNQMLGYYSDKTDIWAFGCVLMEVITSGKRRAFESDWSANKYAERSPDHLLPQVQSSDNGWLDRITQKKLTRH